MSKTYLLRFGIKVPDGARRTDFGALAAEVAEAAVEVHDGRSHDEEPLSEPAHADDARVADAPTPVAAKTERLHALLRRSGRPDKRRRLALCGGPECKKTGHAGRPCNEAPAVRRPVLECRRPGRFRISSFHKPVSVMRERGSDARACPFRIPQLGLRESRPPRTAGRRLRPSGPREVRRPCG